MADLFTPNMARGQLFEGRVPPGTPLHPLGLGFEYDLVQWRMAEPTMAFRRQVIAQAFARGILRPGDLR